MRSEAERFLEDSTGQTNNAAPKSTCERLLTRIRDSKPPYRDNTVACTDRVDRHCNKAVACHTGERRSGEAVRHHDRFGYSTVPRTDE
jgi:hypothetical protein